MGHDMTGLRIVKLNLLFQVYYLGKGSDKSGGVATIDGYQKFSDKDKVCISFFLCIFSYILSNPWILIMLNL